MKDIYNLYLPIENWQVIKTMTIHDYTPDENPIEIVQVQVGRNIVNGHNIIKWMTYQEWIDLTRQGGAVGW